MAVQMIMSLRIGEREVISENEGGGGEEEEEQEEGADKGTVSSGFFFIKQPILFGPF